MVISVQKSFFQIVILFSEYMLWNLEMWFRKFRVYLNDNWLKANQNFDSKVGQISQVVTLYRYLMNKLICLINQIFNQFP